MRASRPVRGPASWIIAIRAPAALDHARRREHARQRVVVDVAVDAVDRRPEPLEHPQHLDAHEVAGVQDRVGGAQLRQAGGRRGRPPMSSDAPKMSAASPPTTPTSADTMEIGCPGPKSPRTSTAPAAKNTVPNQTIAGAARWYSMDQALNAVVVPRHSSAAR